MSDQETRAIFEQIRTAARALWGIDANDAHFLPTDTHVLVVPYSNNGVEFGRAEIDLQHYIDPERNIDLWIGYKRILEQDVVAFFRD